MKTSPTWTQNTPVAPWGQAVSGCGGRAQAGHHVGVHVAAVAVGVLAQQALALEAEALVEADGRLVVRVDLQLQPREVEPVVRQPDARAHERRADALALPL